MINKILNDSYTLFEKNGFSYAFNKDLFNSKYGLILIQNNSITKLLDNEYDSINLNNFYNNYIEVVKDKKKGFIFLKLFDGFIVIEKIIFYDDYKYLYDEGFIKYYKFKSNNKYGLLEIKNEIINESDCIKEHAISNIILDPIYNDFIIINDETELVKKKNLSIMAN